MLLIIFGSFKIPMKIHVFHSLLEILQLSLSILTNKKMHNLRVLN